MSPSPPTAPSPPAAAADEAAPTPEAGNSASAKPGKALLLEGKPLHPGCVSELETETNGDRVVQSIDWRGCDGSNRYSEEPYWDNGLFLYRATQEGDRFGYSVHRTIDEKTHVLLTNYRSAHTYGSLGYLAVRRGEMTDYRSPLSDPPLRTITTLTRLGEVMDVEEVDTLIRAVTAR